MNGLDLVSGVTPKEPYPWTEGRGDWATGPRRAREAPRRRPRLRNQAQHPALPRRLGMPRSRSCPPPPRRAEVLALQARRRLPLQRPRRPGRSDLRGRDHPRRCSASSPSSASASAISSSPWRSGAKTYKLKFGHRGRQPTGEGPGDRPHRNHRRRTTASASISRRCRRAPTVDARAPQRRHLRGPRRARPCARSACSTTPRPPPGPHDALYMFERFVRVDEAGWSDARRRLESCMRTIHFVSLGCVKNRVDTEVMLGVADGERLAHRRRAGRGRGHRRQHVRVHRRGEEGVD